MKIALAMIVKGSDEEAEVLARCLKYTASHVDGIFITITQPNEAVEKACALFGAHVSHFAWCNDFAKARNFNFSQVPKEYDYILWCDADDVIRGIQKLKQTITDHPSDVYTMFYLYSFDEYKNPVVVHQKTRVIKNDGCVSWAGALHEDFTNNRAVSNFHIKGIDILHLTDEKRIETAKTRNLEVAQAEMALKPNDPRTYWNVGNSLKAQGKLQESIDIFDTFLKMSGSDDEKYIARLRIGEAYWGLHKKNEAIDCVRYAIGMKPEYPDAYHLLGSLYFESRKFGEARDMYLMGLTRRPPYYEILVYNPRDYDYTPLMNLAKAYFALSQPMLAVECLKGCLKIYPEDKNTKNIVRLMEKEAKKQEKVLKIVEKMRKIKTKKKLAEYMDMIPDAYKSHPAVCSVRNVHFVKETSSGKDLVIMCGYTEEVWTPQTAKEKGIGGSEEAVIWLSRLWKEKGYTVTVYNNCGNKELDFDGVIYKPFWSWNARDKQDILILWRSPQLLDYDINASKIFVDLHDVVQEGEFNEKRLKKIDKIFVKSEFHRSLFPNIPDEKFVIVPNGIDYKRFEKTDRDPLLLINTSSPDRSISTLIECFKEVKKEVPEARCVWAYGWNVFDSVYGTDEKKMKWKQDMIDGMKEAGIENVGRLNHDAVADLYLQASVFAYPTEFAEIDCISARKAQAGGAIPVTTDFSALDETVQFGTKIHSEKTKDTWSDPYQFDYGMQGDEKKKAWVRAVVKLLKTPPSEKDRMAMRMFQEQFDWKNISGIWIENMV